MKDTGHETGAKIKYELHNQMREDQTAD